MVLQLAGDKKIRVGAKTGRATAASLTLIGGQLSHGDWYDDEEIGPMQAFAWPLLLQGGGLAKMAGTNLELTPGGAKARKNDLAAAIKTIWSKWEKSTLIDEFSRVTAIKGQKSSGGRTMTSPAKRRPMINMLLKELTPGKWIAIEELDRLLQSRAAYAFSMTNYEWKLYFVFVGAGEISPGQTLFLDKIGKRLEVDRWRLSAATLMQAISGGASLADILTTLATASSAPLSQELEQLFREVEQRSTAFVEVGRTTLIECSSEMRNQVLASKTISRLCMPAGDRYLAIFPGKEKLFVSAIEVLGYSITVDPRLQ